MKRSLSFSLIATLLFFASAFGHGQSAGVQPFGLEIGQTPPLQVGVQIQATHANAPPGECGCFWMVGGGVQALRSFTPAWGAVADVYYGRNGQINGTDEQISIFNYVFGPRYTYRTSTRYTPYGQVLVGASRVSSNYYAYQSGDTSLALQGGAGVEIYLKPRFAVPVEADWIHSQALNGVNSRQNNLRVGFGVIYRFGPR